MRRSVDMPRRALARDAEPSGAGPPSGGGGRIEAGVASSSGSMRRGRERAVRATAGVLPLGLMVLAGCYSVGPQYRALHVVDGEVVSSPAPPPSAYEAYLRARLAFEHQPPQLHAAQFYIEEAIRFDPRDPHLWASRAEIEERAGKPVEAAASARRALAIRPGYPLAHEVLARVESRGAAGASATTAAAPASRQP
jgi:tetratricopeptide (TPR) repeat protein